MDLKAFERMSFSYLALFFMLYVAIPSFILSTFLIFRIGTPQITYWVSMAVLSGVIFYKRDKLNIGDYIVFFGILILCHIYAYYIIESSSDGLAYHEPVVRRIANGFNPVYDGYMYLRRPPDLWSDAATYYPKAIWYFGAVLTAAFGDIQTGKVYNLLLIFAALFFVLGATKKEHISKRVLWLIACLNPVALTQIPHYLVDGALSTFSTISLFYAYLYFNDKPITRLQHIFCIISLSMLFCVKTGGFGFGSIILFFIILNDLVKNYHKNSALASAKRFFAALKPAIILGIKIGAPVLLLVVIWGFAPYATNLLNGRDIFYPFVLNGSEKSSNIQSGTELLAESIYPNAGNRFTRLLYSIASHTVNDNIEPAKHKNPFDLSLPDWKAFSYSCHIAAAGLGPFFYLFLLLSIFVPFIFRLRGNGWLLFTLFTLLLIQPYSWIMRFAPFLWIVPFACLMSAPENKCAFYLWIPISLAVVNTLGVAYFKINATWQYSGISSQVCSQMAGEIVMLPQTIFEYDGVFERYGIRQKYVNPEEMDDLDFYTQGVGWGFLPGPRAPGGKNVFLKKHLLPLPETLLVFSEKKAFPWLDMSEGLMSLETMGPNYNKKTIWISYDNKVKFYMSMDKEPMEDWELTLKGVMFDFRRVMREIETRIFINNQMIGTWQVERNTNSITLTIPRALLEDSFRDETRLVTLMLRLQEVSSFLIKEPTCGIQLEEMQIRPKKSSNN